MEASLAKLTKEEKDWYSDVQIQKIHEHYCEIFKVKPWDVKELIQLGANEKPKIVFSRVVLAEGTLKALVATLPFLSRVYEIELDRNSLTDLMASLLLFGVYLSPQIKKLTFVGNPIGKTFIKSFQELIKGNPNRFLELTMSASIPVVDHVEKFVKSCSLNLLRLNLSYISLGMNATRTLNVYLLKHNVLKDLNLMRCGLNNQSARYIVDALARNVTIRHLNISQNDISSTLYEFGIKLASLLSRHPTLLHANFSSTGLTKEETMLVIAAMSTSKSFLALHLSNN